MISSVYPLSGLPHIYVCVCTWKSTFIITVTFCSSWVISICHIIINNTIASNRKQQRQQPLNNVSNRWSRRRSSSNRNNKLILVHLFTFFHGSTWAQPLSRIPIICLIPPSRAFAWRFMLHCLLLLTFSQIKVHMAELKRMTYDFW